MFEVFLVSFSRCFSVSGLIIFLLIIILITCLLSSYAFSALVVNFNDNCVPGAKLAFKRFPSIAEALTDSTKQNAEFYGRKVDELYHEFKTYYMSKELREIDETNAVPKTQIFQFLKNSPTTTKGTTERLDRAYLTTTIPANDSEFFSLCECAHLLREWHDFYRLLIYKVLINARLFISFNIYR